MMQTRRREFVKVSASTTEELEAKQREQDALWRDRGYLRVDGRDLGFLSDIYAVEIVYEEAPHGSEVARRAEAIGQRQPTAVQWPLFAILAGALVLLAWAASQGMLDL